MFIPFYVWLDNVCKIVKHSITAWEVGFELAKINDQIEALEKQKEHNLLILSHLNMDPKTAEQNKKEREKWDGMQKKIYSDHDRD